MEYTTIEEVIRERLIGDLLLSAYDAGYCHASGIAMESPQSPSLALMLTTLAARHQVEVLAMRAWADPPLRHTPAWLQQLQSTPLPELETAPLGNGKAH